MITTAAGSIIRRHAACTTDSHTHNGRCDSAYCRRSAGWHSGMITDFEWLGSFLFGLSYDLGDLQSNALRLGESSMKPAHDRQNHGIHLGAERSRASTLPAALAQRLSATLYVLLKYSYRLGLLRVLLRYCGKTIVLSLDNVGAHGFIYA